MFYSIRQFSPLVLILFSWIVNFIQPIYALSPSNCQQLDPSALATVCVPVKNQTTQTRATAVDTGFVQVMQRLTMQQNLDPAAMTLQADASHYVASYRYQNQKQTKAIQVNHLPYNLIIQFDRTSVLKALLAQQVAVVDAARPGLLTLIASDQTNEKTNYQINHQANPVAQLSLLSESQDQTGFLAKLQQAALVYGVPLVVPAMDLTDLQLLPSFITNQQLFQFGSSTNSAKLRQRYNTPGSLFGQINQLANQQWYATWQLKLANNVFQWSLQAIDLTQLANKTMANIAQQYRKLFAMTSKQQQQVSLSIINIDNLADYAAIRSYLSTLAMVSTIVVNSITADSINLNLSVYGDVQGFIDLLNLQQRLAPIDSDVTGDVPRMVYQWHATATKGAS